MTQSRPLVVATILVALVLVSAAAQAQLVRKTVGPDGDFLTIQAAVNDCPSGILCDVDVHGPYTYPENVTIPSSFTAGSITITGGWNDSFTMRDASPSSTIIDGGGVGRVVNVLIGGGSFTLDGFTVTNGAASNGAGIGVSPDGDSDAIVRLENLLVLNNHSNSASSSYGGGVWAGLGGSERIEVSLCVISSNSATVTSGTDAAAGAGLMITARGTASFLVEHSWIEENTAVSDTCAKRGAGHFFGTVEDATGEVVGLRVTNNTASGSNDVVQGAGGLMRATGNAQIVARRSSWAANSNLTAGTAEQLKLWCEDSASILVTDSAVALGDQHGLDGFTDQTSQLRLVNLTAADNSLTGIDLTVNGAAAISLYNSVSFGNGTNASLDAAVARGNNLIGVDPLFVDPGPPNFNYHLGVGSPGIDAGTNAPPGGLGSVDLDGRPRIENLVVDIGCYEGEGLIFVDGFEGGGTGEWSSTVP